MKGILAVADFSEVLDTLTSLSSAVFVPLVIKGIVLMAIVGTITMAMKRSAPAMRYRIWFTGLVGLLVLPLAIAVVPAWKVYVLPPTPVAASTALPARDLLHSPIPGIDVPAAHDFAVLDFERARAEAAEAERAARTTLNRDLPELATDPIAIVSTNRRSANVNGLSANARTSLTEDVRVAVEEVAGRGLLAAAFETIAASVRSVNWKSLPWTMWFVAVWMVGAAALLFRLGAAHVGVASLVRRSRRVDEDDWQLLLDEAAGQMAVKQRVFLRWSDIAIVPLNAGIVKSIILLPESASEWSEERRRAVLLHELAHVQRQDCLTHFVSQLANAIYWINPFTWHALEKMMSERERAADDAVLAVGTKASTYAQTLLETAQNYHSANWSAPASLAMARKSQLENRMLAILDPTRRPGQPSRANRILTSFIVMMIALPLAAFTPSSAQETQVAADSSKSVLRPAAPVPAVKPDSRQPAANRAPAADALSPLMRVPAPMDRFPELLSEEIDRELRDNLLFDAQIASEAAAGILEGLTAPNVEMDLARNAVYFDEFSAEDLASAMLFTSRSEFEIDGRPLVVGDSLSIEQIIRLRRYGVDGDFIRGIKALGFTSPTYDDLISLARHDADAEYIAAMRAAGFKDLPLADYAGAARYGMSASYAEEMRNAGLGALTLDELIKLSRYDATAELVRDLKSAGVTVSSADDVARLARYGVNPDVVRELRQLGYTSLTVDDLVSFSRYGASTEYVSAMRAAGYTNLSLKELSSLARYDVSPELISALSAAGYRNLTAKELADMGRYGVSAALIKDLAAAGYENLSADDLSSLARYDVDAEYIKGLKSAGFKSMSVKDLRNMKRYGVDLEFIREIQDAGIKAPTPEQLIDMRRHGVDGGFIKSLKSN